MNFNFWKNKKVLITGHTGFKGSWLSLWLQHLGAEVIGVSLDPPTTPSLYKQAKIKSGMEMAGVSLAAALVGYLIGRAVASYFGVDVL